MTQLDRLKRFFETFSCCISCFVPHRVRHEEDDVVKNREESPFRSPMMNRKKKESTIPDDATLEKCPICLTTLLSDKCFVFTKCGHLLHIKCLNRWPEEQEIFCPCCNRHIPDIDGSICVPPYLTTFVKMTVTDRKRLMRGWMCTKK